MYRNFVNAVNSNEKKEVGAVKDPRGHTRQYVEMDVEKEAGLDTEDVTSTVGSSSAPTTLNAPRMSDCKFGWRDISYTVDTKNGKKLILENVTGCVEKGTIPVCPPLFFLSPSVLPVLPCPCLLFHISMFFCSSLP
jgi:hypothetical protein